MFGDTSSFLRLVLRRQLCLLIKCFLLLTSKIKYWTGYAIGLSFMACFKLLVPFKIYELCPVQGIFLKQPWLARYQAITFDTTPIPLRIYGVVNMKYRIFAIPEHLERVVSHLHQFSTSCILASILTTFLQLPKMISLLTFGKFWSISYLNFLQQLKLNSVFFLKICFSFDFYNTLTRVPAFSLTIPSQFPIPVLPVMPTSQLL